MKGNRKNEIPELVLKVGIRIGEIISEKKFRQRDVAHDSGLDVENLRKYIKGRQEMKISTMMKIVEALQVDISDLFDFKES